MMSGEAGPKIGDGSVKKPTAPPSPVFGLPSSILPCAGVFAAGLAAFTGVALYAAHGRDLGWVLAARGPEVVGPSAEGDVSIKVYPSNLVQWSDLSAAPPEEVARLGGRPAEIEGFARFDGDARGFWLVAEPPAALAGRRVPAQARVWVALTGTERAQDLIPATSRVRARGRLSVGRFPRPEGASLDGVYRLALGTVETRPAVERRHGGAPCSCGHDH